MDWVPRYWYYGFNYFYTAQPLIVLRDDYGQGSYLTQDRDYLLMAANTFSSPFSTLENNFVFCLSTL